jgi:asparagine synthase (glutamine-hydrolysing)
MYRDSQDVLIARKISQACNLKHHTLRLDTNFLREYPKNAEKAIYITDGHANITSLDELYLSNQMREITPIVLQGFYGTQVFGRVGLFIMYSPVNSGLINGEFKNNITETSQKLQQYQKENHLTNNLKRELTWFWSGSTLSKMSQLSFRTPYLDNDFIDLMYCAPDQGFDGTEFEIAAISKNRSNLLDFPTNRGVTFNSGFFYSSVYKNMVKLRKSAEIALTSHVLPHSLHHQIAKLDSLFLSPLHLNRLILGFDSFRHYNFWFRNILAPHIKEILLDNRTLSRPYWNSSFIIKIVNDHIQGRGRYMREISRILQLELIYRTLLEGN